MDGTALAQPTLAGCILQVASLWWRRSHLQNATSSPAHSPTATSLGEKMERRWQVLTVVSVAVFMVSLDLFIVNIAFPDIERSFHHSSLATVSWVLNAYAIVLAALLVSAGGPGGGGGRGGAFPVGPLLFLSRAALCGVGAARV